jgi:hypothetical protein
MGVGIEVGVGLIRTKAFVEMAEIVPNRTSRMARSFMAD